MTASAYCIAIALLAIAGSAFAKERAARQASPSLAAYQHRVSDTMGKAWYQKVSRRWRSLTRGTVNVTFSIMPSGMPRDIRIKAKPRDRASADLLRDIMRGIRFPPIPRNVLRELPEGRMPVDFNYTLYPEG